MKVVVEFDMVDLSMHKQVSFFEYIYEKYAWAMRECKIIEPEVCDIKKKVMKERDERIKSICARKEDI